MMCISILTLIKRILRGIKNVMLIFLCYVGVSILLCLVRCNRDEYNYFDRMMLAGWNTSDTIVDLSRLTPFQWDTMYYYENGCSEEVMASFGVIADADMQDVIIFKDKEGRTGYLRVSSDDALFIVRLKTKRTIMLEHLPRGKVRQN